jgi:hypothetical protein
MMGMFRTVYGEQFAALIDPKLLRNNPPHSRSPPVPLLLSAGGQPAAGNRLRGVGRQGCQAAAERTAVRT